MKKSGNVVVKLGTPDDKDGGEFARLDWVDTVESDCGGVNDTVAVVKDDDSVKESEREVIDIVEFVVNSEETETLLKMGSVRLGPGEPGSRPGENGTGEIMPNEMDSKVSVLILEKMDP